MFYKLIVRPINMTAMVHVIDTCFARINAGRLPHRYMADLIVLAGCNGLDIDIYRYR